jgi:methyl-accepting chemotaxis protein
MDRPCPISVWPQASWAAGIALPGAAIVTMLNGVSWTIPLLLCMSFAVAWLGLQTVFRRANTLGMAAGRALAEQAYGNVGKPAPKQNAAARTGEPPVFELQVFLPGIAEHFQAYRAVFQRASVDAASVSEETETATTAIVVQLKAISEAMATLLAFLDRSSANNNVLDILKRTGEQLTDDRSLITNCFKRRDGEMLESRERLAEVEAVTQTLAQDVQSIRDVAQRTRMLALNAAIEASRAGEHGAGFGVVASEVKMLSQQSDQAAAKIGQGLTHLHEAVRINIARLSKQNVDEERAQLDASANSVVALSKDLEHLVNDQRDALVKVKHESDQIAKPIVHLMGSIQFQDIVRQRLEHLQKIFRVAEANSTTLENSLSRLSTGEGLPPVHALVEITADPGPSPSLRSKAESGLAAIELF